MMRRVLVLLVVALASVGLIGAAPASAGPVVADHLVLTASNPSIPAGFSVRIIAEAYDAAGNDLGDVTPFTDLTMVPGSGGAASSAQCLGGYCRALVPGAYLVVGTYDNGNDTFASGTVPLTVTAPLIVSLYPSLDYSTTLYDGTFSSYSLDAVYSNDSHVDATTLATATTSNPAVVLARNGRLLVRGPGTARISFSFDEAYSYSDLIVLHRKVTATAVDPSAVFVNDLVTISGTNLDTVRTVTLRGGKQASIVTQQPRSLVVSMPYRGQSGPLTLDTGHGLVRTPPITFIR